LQTGWAWCVQRVATGARRNDARKHIRLFDWIRKEDMAVVEMKGKRIWLLLRHTLMLPPL
jgi:hypothetical protein